MSEVVKYLEKNNDRPSLTGAVLSEEIFEIFNMRKPLYEECSKYSFRYTKENGKDKTYNVLKFSEYIDKILS